MRRQRLQSPRRLRSNTAATAMLPAPAIRSINSAPNAACRYNLDGISRTQMMQTARDKIRELRALHDDGLLSLQEFDRRKNAILDAEYAPPGGTATPVAPLVRQGTELGLMSGQEIGPQNRRYRLERLIGMGGMGQVWQATDLATHAELGHSDMVALKILPPQLTLSATHAKLLIEEATQARKLAHEHIVRVYEWAQDPATASYFIIMEYLEGQDLDAYLARSAADGGGDAVVKDGKVPLSSVYDLLQPVAEALQYAWEKHKLVHRDIKPGNVFLTRHGEIKLLDFGIASRVRSAGSSLGLQTPNAGTAGYRAPEAGTHQRQPHPQLDVYAVAVMIYQMLEGRVPFDDGRSADFHPPAPARLNLRQWQVLQSGFAYASERRPATVAELLDALRRAAGPSDEELAAQAQQERAREQRSQKELAAQAEEQRAQEQHAGALEKMRADKIRRDLEAKQRVEAEAAAKIRKQQLREQLQARRDADALQAQQEREEQQRKALQLKAETAYRAEQERHRKELAERNAAELKVLMPTPGSPVADPTGVLRDRFVDGTGVGPDLVLIPTG